MVFHQIAGQAPERFLHRSNLDDNVGAIALLFDHTLEPTNLTFNPPQSLQICGLKFWVDSGGFATIDGAACTRERSFCWKPAMRRCHIYPPSLYIPLPPILCQNCLHSPSIDDPNSNPHGRRLTLRATPQSKF